MRQLCRGLPFLCSIARAKTYDERSRALKLKTARAITSVSDPPRNLISILLWGPKLAGDIQTNTWRGMRRGPPVSSYTAKELEEEACTSDGPQDSTCSSSFRIWLAHHTRVPYTLFLDVIMLTFAYTVWDNTDMSVARLEEICTNISGCRDYFQRYGHDWTDKDYCLTEKRRKDVYKAGGRGYWPKGGLDDFSGIINVRERRREQLIQKWRKEAGNGEDEYPWLRRAERFSLWSKPWRTGRSR